MNGVRLVGSNAAICSSPCHLLHHSLPQPQLHAADWDMACTTLARAAHHHTHWTFKQIPAVTLSTNLTLCEYILYAYNQCRDVEFCKANMHLSCPIHLGKCTHWNTQLQAFPSSNHSAFYHCTAHNNTVYHTIIAHKPGPYLCNNPSNTGLSLTLLDLEASP
jgi:hypothetical protein